MGVSIKIHLPDGLTKSNKMRYKYIIIALLFAANAMAQTVMDVHSHIVTDGYMQLLKQHGAELEDGYPLPEWSVEKHLTFMQEAGIDCTVLSMPSPQPYFGDAEESRRCIRSINEEAARAKAEHPDKFLFCASLPLPDVQAAIREAVYALDTLHADGIKLATNSRGQYLGDKALDTLMAILNARKTVVIMHPHTPVQRPENTFTGGPIFVYEYPAETTRAVINMIENNIMVRYPDIKFVVPHSGSFLPIALPRLRAAQPLLVRQGLMRQVDIDRNLKNLYYDLAGGPTPDMLKMLLTVTTPDHIMYGSDYGFVPNAALVGVLKRIKGYLHQDAELKPYAEGMLGGSARKLFKQ